MVDKKNDQEDLFALAGIDTPKKEEKPVKKETKEEKKESMLFGSGFNIEQFYIPTGEYDATGQPILKFDNDAYEKAIEDDDVRAEIQDIAFRELEEEWKPAAVDSFPNYYEKCFAPYMERFELCARVYKRLVPEMLSQDMRFSANLIMNYYDDKNPFDPKIDYTSPEWIGKKPRPTNTETIKCIHEGRNFTMSEMAETGIDKVQKEVLLFKNTEWDAVQLDTQQKFYALKMWVGGIVTNQYESMKIQEEIERKGSSTPLSPKITEFVFRSNPNFANYFFDRMKADCTQQIGNMTIPIDNCMIMRGKAMFDILDLQMSRGGLKENDYERFVEKVLDLNPPIALFDEKNPRTLESPKLIDHPQFTKLFTRSPQAFDIVRMYEALVKNPRIFDSRVYDITQKLFDPTTPYLSQRAYQNALRNPSASNLANFCDLLDKADSNGLAILLENKNLGDKCRPQIDRLFKSKDIRILEKLVENASLVNHPDFIPTVKKYKLYTAFGREPKLIDAHPDVAKDILEGIKDSKQRDHLIIKQNMAKSEKLAMFDEFGVLLSPTQGTPILFNAINNPESVNFSEFHDLFDVHSNDILTYLAGLSHATESPKFIKLFNVANENIFKALASNPKIMEVKDNNDNYYANLLMSDEFNPFSSIRANLADKNINAIDPTGTKFPQFDQMFNDESTFVRMVMAQNPSNITKPLFTKLLSDSETDVRIMAVKQDQAPVLYPKEFGNLLKSAKARNDVFVLQAALQNINAPNVPEFKEFFEFKAPTIPASASRSKARSMIDYTPRLRAIVAGHPRAVPFSQPNEYPSLFTDTSNIVRKEVALNPTALTTYPVLAKKLFDDKVADVRYALVRNPIVWQNPMFKDDFAKFFKDSNDDIREYACEKMTDYMRIHQLTIVPPNNC